MHKIEFEKYNNILVKNTDFNSYLKINENIKNEFTNGNLKMWLLENNYVSESELIDLKKCAKYVQKNCDIFVVIGIGGSYMGSKAIISAFQDEFSSQKTKIIFLGKNLNSHEIVHKLKFMQDKDIIVNVISKSGGTLEPSIAFDLVYEFMSKKYTKEQLKERIIITTDARDGKLRNLVNEKGYTSFVIPRNVGGRFSVFTPVGLLPMLVADVNIDEIFQGLKDANQNLDLAFKYAMIRDILYTKGKVIENYVVYDERLIYFTEWLKQLYAETQGKSGKGIFPVSSVNTRDLHSLGQFLQDGNDIIFETVIAIKNNQNINVETYHKSLNEINNMVVEKVCQAHYNGNTPSTVMWMDDLDEYHLGYLMQIFMLSAIIGAYYLEVDPFNQPGVEEYKKLVWEAL